MGCGEIGNKVGVRSAYGASDAEEVEGALLQRGGRAKTVIGRLSPKRMVLRVSVSERRGYEPSWHGIQSRDKRDAVGLELDELFVLLVANYREAICVIIGLRDQRP